MSVLFIIYDFNIAAPKCRFLSSREFPSKNPFRVWEIRGKFFYSVGRFIVLFGPVFMCFAWLWRYFHGISYSGIFPDGMGLCLIVGSICMMWCFIHEAFCCVIYINSIKLCIFQIYRFIEYGNEYLSKIMRKIYLILFNDSYNEPFIEKKIFISLLH